MHYQITIGLLLLLSSAILSANSDCSATALNKLHNEVITVFKLAEKDPYDMAPCKETSKSDLDQLKGEFKSLVKGVFKGKVPNPITSALKAFFSPSEVGTSSQLCPIPSQAVKTAKYQLNQYQMILHDCNKPSTKN